MTAVLVRTVSSLRAASPPEVLERVTRECAISTLPATFGSGEAELVALACELKPLVRQELTDDALEATRQRGLPGGVALTLGARAGTRTRVYLSRDEARAREAIAAEARGDPRRIVGRDQLEREIALAAFLLSTSRTSDFLVFPFTAAARPTTP